MLAANQSSIQAACEDESFTSALRSLAFPHARGSADLETNLSSCSAVKNSQMKTITTAVPNKTHQKQVYAVESQLQISKMTLIIIRTWSHEERIIHDHTLQGSIAAMSKPIDDEIGIGKLSPRSTQYAPLHILKSQVVSVQNLPTVMGNC